MSRRKKKSRSERWTDQGTMAAPESHRSHASGWTRMARNKDAQEFIDQHEHKLQSMLPDLQARAREAQ